MTENLQFAALPTTAFADVVKRENIMDMGIRPLWLGMPRVAGPAFTVQCAPGDNLMLHAAIYRAPVGSILVVQGCDSHYAVAGGNVCKVAQRRGIKALIVDGVIRDVAEVQECQFPVFARGASPIPGAKNVVLPLNEVISCGGIQVTPGDMVVADDEGIVVIPNEICADVLQRTLAKAKADSEMTLDEWATAHRNKIEKILREKGISL